MMRWKAQSISILEGFLNLSEIILIHNNINHPFSNAVYLHDTLKYSLQSIFHKIGFSIKLQ